jgi:hypothetical protein
MGQIGFWDVRNRHIDRDAKADPLVKLAECVPWADFRPNSRLFEMPHGQSSEDK